LATLTAATSPRAKGAILLANCTAGRQALSADALRVRVEIPYTPASPAATPATPPATIMASRFLPALDEGLLDSDMIGETPVVPRAGT
jgi:hypothetical protein